jgi:hypothetical protein
MINSRDSTVYFFDPNNASLLHGTIQSRTGVRKHFCGPEFVHVQVTHASLRSSVHALSRQVRRLLGSGLVLSMLAQLSVEWFAPNLLRSGDTENGMSCALDFLSTCLEIQLSSTGLGPIGLEGRLTWIVSTLARGSFEFDGCASPSVKMGGLSKYPSTGFYLAFGKWHGTMPSWGMKWATP